MQQEIIASFQENVAGFTEIQTLAPVIEKIALKKALSKIEGTDIEKLLKEYHIL